MKHISIIGVPSDYGQRRRGVDMGPSAIRYSGVIERLQALNYKVKDEGDIRLKQNKADFQGDPKLLNLEEIIHLSEELASKVSQVIADNSIPLVLGVIIVLQLGHLQA